MSDKRALLLYISEASGHHCASLAIEKALRQIEPSIETLNINSFNYTNPILEKVINTVYMEVIKRKPEFWDYLYDNPKVMKNTQGLRDMIHRFNTGKLKTLLDDFKPSAIICTQAFPCGMIADYKKSFGLNIPLVAVLTDYAPHSYWIYDSVNKYIVPSEDTARKLINDGVDPGRIAHFGIPIDAKFGKKPEKAAIYSKIGLDPRKPSVLVMGGTQGLGPIKELINILDRSNIDIQMIVPTGTNKKLYGWLSRRVAAFRKKVIPLPFASNIDEIMEISTVIITKPGGITTAEALSKGLPMLIVHPLPGQEAMNTRFLLKEGVAVKAETPEDAAVILEELLYNKDKLRIMSEKAKALAKPDSSMDIAKLVLGLAS
jgi:processive 1,2-diacylglycerol beta-glucosyltransferase